MTGRGSRSSFYNIDRVVPILGVFTVDFQISGFQGFIFQVIRVWRLGMSAPKLLEIFNFNA